MTDSTKPREQVKRAELLEHEGQDQAALDIWEKLARAHPHVLFSKRVGLLAQKMGRLQHAREAYESAVRLDPADSSAYSGLAEVAAARKDHRESIDFYTKAIEIEPRALTLLAFAQRQDGQLSAARQSLQRALELDPGFDEAWLQLGLCYIEDDLSKAEQLARKAVDLDPEYSDNVRVLGVIVGLQSRHAEAVKLLRRAVELAPDKGSTQTYLGNELRLSGELKAAEKCFREAICLRTRGAAPLIGLANIRWAQGEAAAARTFFERALDRDPTSFVAHMEFGLFFRDQGKVREAKQHWIQALRSEPEFAKVKLRQRVERLLVEMDPKGDLKGRVI